MVDSISNDQGAVALDINQLQNWLRGDTIVTGVTPSAGGGSLEVDVASGTARVGGSNVAVSGQTATLSSGGSDPRKDLVYIDSGGNVQVAQGTGASARPSGSVRFDTYQPAPPDSTGITGAVVATVWVASGKSGTFASADIRDRRLLSTVDLDSVTTDNLGLGDVTGDGIPAQAIEHGKAWADDGQLYSTVQAAENAATNVVIVGPGTFSEAVVIDTAGLLVVGSGRNTIIDGGTTDHALDATANGVSIKNLAAKTTAGQGNSIRPFRLAGDGQSLENVWVEESDENGVQVDMTDGRVVGVYCDSANIDGSDVRVGGTADTVVVDDVIGTVSVSGSATSITTGDTA